MLHSRPILRVLPLLAVLLAPGLLALNTAAWRPIELAELRAPRRYWEDLVVASAAYYRTSRETYSVQSVDGNELRHAFMRYVAREVAQAGFAPWEFWRTLPVKPYLRGPRLELRASDDHGRSLLTAAAFRLLGGMAPLLPLWLGALCASPILVWLALELAAAGRGVAALALPLLLTTSAYFVECLSLPYSAMGFYLLALLALATLAIHALLGRSGPRGFVLRSLAAGGVWALCILCRSSAFFLLPGFLLALGFGFRRRTRAPFVPQPVGRLGRAAFAGALLAAFLGPYLLLARTQHHEVWLGLWEGLGDFDTSKGHHWNDAWAKEFLRSHGREASEDEAIWMRDNEDFFRDRVIGDIVSDPTWYAAILAKRALASVTQARLWTPWPRALEPSEVVIDTYYGMAAAADRFGLGAWRFRIPMPGLIAATLLLIALAARSGGGEAGVLLCLALAALGLPVGFTTASGLETQAFALVYFVGLALLVERAARELAPRG